MDGATGPEGEANFEEKVEGEAESDGAAERIDPDSGGMAEACIWQNVVQRVMNIRLRMKAMKVCVPCCYAAAALA